APLPAAEKAAPALAKAEKAMKDAAADLDKEKSADAVPAQDKAIDALKEAKADLAEKIAEMEKRRDDIAKLVEAGKKLDKLLKEETKIADAAKAPMAKEDAAAKNLANKQGELTPPTKDLAKELDKTAPKAAEKVADSTKDMADAKKGLENNDPMKG